MDDVELKNLLESADATAPAPPLTNDLSTRVRLRAKRRARAKMVMVAVLLASLASLPLYLEHPATPPPIASSEPIRMTTANLKAEIAALDAQARQHEMIAHLLEQQETLIRLRQREARADEKSFEDLTAGQYVTAQLMVSRADGLANSPGNRAQAVRGYQRVIELFSQTPQAALAARRLAELKNQT